METADSVASPAASVARAAMPPHLREGDGHDDGGRQFLRLALGNDMYAVGIDSVREILEIAHITPLPLMPSFVRGVMNLRGAVVPVIDLSARLGMDPAVVARRSCVVMVDVRTVDATASTLGMLVDAVYEVFEAGAHEQEAPPRLGTRIDPGFIRSMVRLRGKPTPELNLDTLLDARTLADLIASSTASSVTTH